MLNKCYNLETKYLGWYKLHTLYFLSSKWFSQIQKLYESSMKQYNSKEEAFLPLMKELVFIVL